MAGGCGGAGQAGGAGQQAAFSVGGPGNGGGLGAATAQFDAAMRIASAGFGQAVFGQTGIGGGFGQGGFGMPGLAGFSPMGAQGIAGAAGSGMGQGSSLLAQAMQAGRVAFYGENGGRQAFDMVGQVLDRDPNMLQAFAQALTQGETFQFGMRNGGGPSFSTVGARDHMIEYNRQDFARAPYGPMEVVTHELMHAMGGRFGLGTAVNQNHGPQFYTAVNASLQRQGIIG